MSALEEYKLLAFTGHGLQVDLNLAEAAIAELEAALTAAINIAVTARQNYDENGNGFRPLADIEAEVRKDVKRLAGKKT